MEPILTNRPSVHLFVLSALCLAVFANTLANDFVWDDLGLITRNYHIRNYRNIPLFFTGDHWKQDRSSQPNTGFRPLREVSFTVDYLIWGLTPPGFHLTNLLLHTINVVLIYYLVLTLTAAAGHDSRTGIVGRSGFCTPAFRTALLFALHPIHTESVSYIKNRSDLLAFIFFQGACLLYICWHSATNKKAYFYYLMALLCFLLALWSKPMALTLPLVLSMYAICFPDQRTLSKRLISLLPFFLVALAYCRFQQSFLLAADAKKIGFAAGNWHHIWTVAATLGWYLKMLVWPVPLNADHLFYPPVSVRDLSVLLPIAALIVMFFVLIKTRHSEKLFFFGLGWVLITLIPIANLIYLETRPVAEQRLYIPSFGFCLLLALIIEKMPAMLTRTGLKGAARSVFPYVMTATICAAYAVVTVQRNFEWRDEPTLFSSTVSLSPGSARARNNLGAALWNQGKLDEAIYQYKIALQLQPNQALTYNNLGVILGEKGQFSEAIHYFETALLIRPRFPAAHNNLGLALSRQGRPGEAIYHYRAALTQEPDNALRHFCLAEALTDQGQLDEAIDHYQAALDLDPDDAIAHNRLGAALLKNNDQAGAGRHFARAREIDPATFVLPPDCSR